MHHRILADALVFVHLAFILFVAVGALLTWRWPRVAWIHLPALAWAVGSVTVGLLCPLTGLEKALRRRSDGHAYEGGFVDQYLEDVLYPQELSSRLRAVAAVVILVGYCGCLRRRRQRTPGLARTAALGSSR